MIASLARKMESMLISGSPAISPELSDEIRQAEVEAYLSGAFGDRETERLSDIRDFYERLVVLLVEARDFEALPLKFALLARLYQHPLSQRHPSLYEAKLTSLHLLHLYTGKGREEFQVRLAGLSPQIANSAEVRTIVDFDELIDLGNYQRAFDIIQTLSPSHQVLLSRLVDQRRYQTCKMVEYSYPGIQVSDLAKILELKSEEDFEGALAMIGTLFEQGEINWHVVDRTRIEKREKASHTFNDEKMIRDTIGLLRDFEKII